MSSSSAHRSPAILKFARLWYLLGAIMLLAVAIVSLMPAPPQVGVDDKTSHLLTYLVLGAWFAALAGNCRALLIGAAGLVVYGALLEIFQGLGGHRFAEWGDLFANTAGIIGGSLCYLTPLPRLLRLVDSRIASSLGR